MIVLSIITVCYNAEHELKKTVDSIICQELSAGFQIEHVIIDNNSDDETQKIVEIYKEENRSNQIIVQYIRENDDGIYDAMNKGILIANGEWVMFLNAGDTFYDSITIKGLEPYLKKDAEILIGYYNRQDPSGNIFVRPPIISKLYDRMIFCHQAMIFNISTHRNFFYNTKYRIVADYDVALRMIKNNVTFLYIDVCIVNYDVNGISARKMIDTHKEMYKVRKDNGVINNYFKSKLYYYYGLYKRKILLWMPQSLRWKMVGIRNKFFERKYL